MSESMRHFVGGWSFAWMAMGLVQMHTGRAGNYGPRDFFVVGIWGGLAAWGLL
jgi:hypothetical protein